ncbi:MAG TPA: WYL domain-containing protein [Flavobacteriales bacterium]|nr:WYL domain-containing protein [Flavobacteriales bacterium]
MPINKLALVRYKTIDNCLQNRFRKWTLEDLVEACSDALYEYEGITKGVSLRTVQLDIQNMRSEKLGYNAPIVVVNKKYYTYEDKNYSITNIPLTRQDLGTLSEVVDVLKQFKGFGYFDELNGMVSRLEDKIYKQTHKGKSYIHFERNDLLKGLEFIDPVHKAILNKKTLEISYQSFKAREAMQLIFYPYLLKEYRNRWFAVGMKKDGTFLTLALDRIVEIKVIEKEKYVKNTLINTETFYDNAIGVTKSLNQREIPVVFKLDRMHVPYVQTKPIHASQKLLERHDDGSVFRIDVVWNYELEREILGFGEYIEIMAPRNLRKKIGFRLGQAFSKYEAG